MKFCEYCGTKINTKDHSCSNCGAKLYGSYESFDSSNEINRHKDSIIVNNSTVLENNSTKEKDPEVGRVIIKIIIGFMILFGAITRMIYTNFFPYIFFGLVILIFYIINTARRRSFKLWQKLVILIGCSVPAGIILLIMKD